MTRPELYVFLALSVGWMAIAAWTFRIARKVDRLAAPERAAADTSE